MTRNFYQGGVPAKKSATKSGGRHSRPALGANPGWVAVAIWGLLHFAAVFPLAAQSARAGHGIQEWMQQAHAHYVASDFLSARAALDKAASIDPDSNAVRLQRGLLLDGAGQFVDARRLYDQLLTSETTVQVLIPSAINYVALGRTASASLTFKRVLQTSYIPEERDYARVWLRFLAMRGEPQDRGSVAGEKMETRRYVPLLDAIAAPREIDEVAASVKAMRFSSAREERAISAEYYYFLGSIEMLNSVNDSANRFFRMALSVADGSVERPLILLALDDLHAQESQSR